jgi:hypothetical protein
MSPLIITLFNLNPPTPQSSIECRPTSHFAGPQVVTLKPGAEKKKGRRGELAAEDEEMREGGENKKGRRKKAKKADQEGEEDEVRCMALDWPPMGP